MTFREASSGKLVRNEATLFSGMLAGLTGLSAIALITQALNPEPLHFLGLTLDRLSVLLMLLVSFIGTVTLRYSINYLDGNPRQRRFLRLLFLTVVSAFLLMCSTNLLLLFVFWSLTSLGLHQLLTIYHDRKEAFRPARKKFVISRLGDAALLSAIYLIWHDWHTLDLQPFLNAVATQSSTGSPTMIALLIALAAITKSAQFPFHTWLPETMESPTPVSALMHAGIINAGGVLLLRFAGLISRVPEVLLLLSVIGTITFAIGMISMWAQVKVKRALAWSTVSQMGFMMVQCGLGAFPAALLHMIGHGCYKAWNFLRSGEVTTTARPVVAPMRALVLSLLGALAAAPALVLASWVTGYSPLHSPGEIALASIVALSIGQIWVALLGPQAPNYAQLTRNTAIATALTIASSALAFSLYQGAGSFMQPVLGELAPATGTAGYLAAIIPTIVLISLIVLQAVLPVIGQSKFGRTLHVHALNGFYLGTIADRMIDSLKWRSIGFKSGVNNA